MKYHPLLTEHIRLLQLHPGKQDTDIELSIIPNIPLNQTPDYHALSYTWGDENITQPIKVDGSPLRVTSNLAVCLLHLRQDISPGEVLLLWIDGICINQNDHEEKNRQILLMRRIYQRSVCTIVWLGPEEDDTREGLSLMNRWREHRDGGTLDGFLMWLRRGENVETVKVSFGL